MFSPVSTSSAPASSSRISIFTSPRPMPERTLRRYSAAASAVERINARTFAGLPPKRPKRFSLPFQELQTLRLGVYAQHCACFFIRFFCGCACCDCFFYHGFLLPFFFFNTLSLSRFGVKGGGDNSLYLFLASEIIGRIAFIFLRISALLPVAFFFSFCAAWRSACAWFFRLNLIGDLFLQVCGQRLYLPIRL